MPYQQVQATPPPPPEQEEGWDWWQKALLGVGAIGAGVMTGGAAGLALAPAAAAGATAAQTAAVAAPYMFGGASIGAGVGGGIAQSVPQMGPGGGSATGTMTSGTQSGLSTMGRAKPQTQPTRVSSLYGGMPVNSRTAGASAPELAGMTLEDAKRLGISEAVWRNSRTPLGMYNMQAYGNV